MGCNQPKTGKKVKEIDYNGQQIWPNGPKIRTKMKHPYEEYETSKLWKIVKSSIEDLVENNDIELFTPIEYIVGYICKIYPQRI